MTAVVAIALKLFAALGPLAPLLQKLFSTGSSVAIAIIAAVPPTIEALGRFLEFLAKNAFAAFFFGCILAGSGGFIYGLKWDAPLRERAKQSVIDAANRNVDAVLAREKARMEKLIAQAQRERDAAKAALAKASKKR